MPFRFVVSTWYVAMVTGRISFFVPLYSPISSSVSEVRLISSLFHCRAETVLVTRISVVAFASAIAPAPTSVLPAPQGSTTTPDPPCQNPSTACFWYGRSAQPSSASSMACASPSTYPARSSAGQPSFSRACLIWPRSEGCTATVSGSIRAPTSGWIFFERRISSSTGRSVEVRTRPCAGCLVRVSRPYRSIVSAMSTSRACGTGYREYSTSASTTCSASWPAARAFHRPSGVSR